MRWEELGKQLAKPCPYCGSQPWGRIRTTDLGKRYNIKCRNRAKCVCPGTHSVSVQKALVKWNYRYNEQKETTPQEGVE